MRTGCFSLISHKKIIKVCSWGYVIYHPSRKWELMQYIPRCFRVLPFILNAFYTWYCLLRKTKSFKPNNIIEHQKWPTLSKRKKKKSVLVTWGKVVLCVSYCRCCLIIELCASTINCGFIIIVNQKHYSKIENFFKQQLLQISCLITWHSQKERERERERERTIHEQIIIKMRSVIPLSIPKHKSTFQLCAYASYLS